MLVSQYISKNIHRFILWIIPPDISVRVIFHIHNHIHRFTQLSETDTDDRDQEY